MRRLVLSPRWILWHLLTLGAMAACGWLAVWQWERAGSAMGSAINVGYGLQWPAFAVFFGVMWWRFLRMELHDLHEREQRERERSEHGLPERRVVARGTAECEVPDRRSPERASGVREPAAPPVDAAAPNPPEHPPLAPAGPSPFTRTPLRQRVATAVQDPHGTRAADVDPELAEYNLMLARLAERDNRNRR